MSKRYTPTPEQTAKRERTIAMVTKLSAMTETERRAILDAAGAPIITCEGRALSMFNACLVLTQAPNATMVGGFRQWIAKGRCVARGQKALSIWIPRGDSQDAPADGAASTDGAEKAKPRFTLGSVFDVSQTAPLAEGAIVAETETESVAA